MHRLLYISTAREPIDRKMVADILRVARLRNEREGITGLLLAGRTRFMQILEGDRYPVQALFDDIAKDPRHHSCVILRSGEGERQFDDWSMGYIPVDDDTLAGENRALFAMVEAITDKEIRAEMEGFVAIQRDGKNRAA